MIMTKKDQKSFASDFVFGPTWYPGESVVKFTARYLKRRTGIKTWQKKRNVKRILDAGCGNGRHVIFFSEQGFDVYGIDISKDAIRIADEWLNSKCLNAELRVGSLTDLPYENGFFDVIISYGVLDHMSLSDLNKSIREIKRVLKADGYFHLTLRSTEDSEFGRGKELEHNIFRLDGGYAKGTIQHYFDLDEIRRILDGFKILDLILVEEKFPDEYTIDKAFLQSSTDYKKYLDISQINELNLKYSRWHITAENV